MLAVHQGLLAAARFAHAGSITGHPDGDCARLSLSVVGADCCAEDFHSGVRCAERVEAHATIVQGTAAITIVNTCLDVTCLLWCKRRASVLRMLFPHIGKTRFCSGPKVATAGFRLAIRPRSGDGDIIVRSHRDDASLTISVVDPGIGIAPENLENVFDPFWQVEQRSTRRAGGTGLGLSVSRRLARLLGGEVTVQSALNKGSTFTLVLPDLPISA